jgi:hypothetical protein
MSLVDCMASNAVGYWGTRSWIDRERGGYNVTSQGIEMGCSRWHAHW